MTWKQFSHGFRVNPIVNGSPDALVVLLHDLGATSARLMPIAARWATAMPKTAFVALDGIEQLEPPSYGSTEPTVLDRAARNLRPLLDQHLRTFRLDTSRFVLAGFGYGGTLALHMSLRLGLSCAGVLAFGAKLHPLPRILRADSKVRLIESAEDRHPGHRRLRDSAALLAARGVDTQEVLLLGEFMSDEAIGHGSAYLNELVGSMKPIERPQLCEERRYAHQVEARDRKLGFKGWQQSRRLG
jgi:predicted esterase